MYRLILSIFLSISVFTASFATVPLQQTHLHGIWQLKYRGNYGYRFHFYKNYRAICIIYLGSSTVVFKGIYTIEENTKLRINIYEMKNFHSSRINFHSGFTKVSSSYFIFEVQRKNRVLKLVPEKALIDGRSSQGYFEPIIKLKKI